MKRGTHFPDDLIPRVTHHTTYGPNCETKLRGGHFHNWRLTLKRLSEEQYTATATHKTTLCCTGLKVDDKATSSQTTGLVEACSCTSRNELLIGGSGGIDCTQNVHTSKWMAVHVTAKG